MTTHLRVVVAAAVVGLAGGVCAHAQTPAAGALGVRLPLAASDAAVRSGAITSLVRDGHGSPVAGAIVSAVGGRTATAMTDARGRCTISPLPVGDYLVRVHRTGFSVANSLIVRVTSGGMVAHSVVLTPLGLDTALAAARRAGEPEVMAAGFAPAGTAGSTVEGDAAESDHDHSDTAWRLRHLKRSVLRDAVDKAGESDQDDLDAIDSGMTTFFGRAMSAPVRAAAALFDETPLTGQVNLLTTSTFDSPDQLLSDMNFARGVAYVSLGAAAGQHGDWSVQGAMTQGDVASWIFAGSFIARPPATHQYEIGISYATQRYTGANPAALASVVDGTRNAGAVFVFDTWTISKRASVVYGARYSKYGYIDRALFSPRVQVTVTPFDRYDKLRLRLSASRRAEAPGAEEFVPGAAANTWVPPERTFAPLIGTTFTPERTHTYQAAVERDLSSSSVVAVRSFYQRTWDQTATLFGVGRPERTTAANLDHYLVSDAGGFVARGWGVSVQQVVARRLRGTLDYTVTTASWQPSADSALLGLFVPSAIRAGRERLQDVTTSIETDIPRTATRVYAMYRINTAYAGPAFGNTTPHLGARFDVQVTQSLPFLNFTSAQWEALVGVRNLFHELAADSSVYDELLVVRPPKRVVGGVTVRF